MRQRPHIETANYQGDRGSNGTIAKPFAIQKMNAQSRQRENSKRTPPREQSRQHRRHYPVLPAKGKKRTQQQCNKKRFGSAQKRPLKPIETQQRKENRDPATKKPVAKRDAHQRRTDAYHDQSRAFGNSSNHPYRGHRVGDSPKLLDVGSRKRPMPNRRSRPKIVGIIPKLTAHQRPIRTAKKR